MTPRIDDRTPERDKEAIKARAPGAALKVLATESELIEKYILGSSGILTLFLTFEALA